MAGKNEIYSIDYKFGGNVEFLSKIETLLQRIDKSFTATDAEAKKVGQDMSSAFDKADKSLVELKDDTSKLSNGFENLTSKVKGFVMAYASIQGVSKAMSFGMGSMALADVQSKSERQLQLVMRNMGNAAAFDSILKEASAIQGRTIYGDEAMIAGAGELATYVKDPQQLKRMMNLLTDYAAGMTGGGEVGSQQMVQLATGLGMAFDGNYRALRMKGFDTSELESLGDDATEAQRIDALARSLETWKGLAAEMNKDPSAAAIRLKNKLGDLREELGKRLYPVYNKMIESLDKNLPSIEKMIGNVGSVASKVFEAFGNNVDSVMKFGEGLGRVAEKAINLASVGAPIVAKLIEIPGLVESIMTALAVEKFSGIASGLNLVNGGFARLGSTLAQTNKQLILIGQNGKNAAMGIAAVVGGGMAGAMGGASTSGGVIAGGLTTAGATFAATGNPFLALLAGGGSFLGSTINAAYKAATHDYSGVGKESEKNANLNDWNMRLGRAYRRFQADGNDKNKREYDRLYKLYANKYSREQADELLGFSRESAEAKTSVINNNVTNNNNVTQNNTIGAEFGQLSSIIRQNLYEIVERNLQFDFKTMMEVAGA